ncbi:MAG: GNAT family N-acetyltransferase [Pirellulales bacterium]
MNNEVAQKNDDSQEIRIRAALRSDCHEMMQLIHELAEFERAPDEVTVSFDHFVESGFGSHPVWYALVATHGSSEREKLIGFALYYIRYSTWKGQRLYLEDLLVTQEYRGQGIGRRLMEALIEEAKRREFSGMAWQALDWNEPAIRFYESYGAVANHEWINFQLDL